MRKAKQMNDLHNRTVTEIMPLILLPLREGGTMTEVLTILESVIVGTIGVAVRSGGDDHVIDMVVAAAKERLVDIRTLGGPARGSA